MKALALVGVLAIAVGAGACMPGASGSGGGWVVTDDWNQPDRGRPAKERQSRVPAMAGGALLGGALGYVLGAAACDDLHETDEECSDRAVEGALLGGGVGALIGAVVGN
jgi:hypothetical protein